MQFQASLPAFSRLRVAPAVSAVAAVSAARPPASSSVIWRMSVLTERVALSLCTTLSRILTCCGGQMASALDQVCIVYAIEIDVHYDFSRLTCTDIMSLIRSAVY
jgi:hypothetical protein